jgi:hypothetical protein
MSLYSYQERIKAFCYGNKHTKLSIMLLKKLASKRKLAHIHYVILLAIMHIKMAMI